MAKAVFGPPYPKVEVRPQLSAQGTLPLEGIWAIERIDDDVTMADITAFGSSISRQVQTSREVQMILRLEESRELPRTPTERETKRVELALKDNPPEVQRAVEALFQLEEALPADREAIVDVEVGDDGKPKFTVAARTKPPPSKPDEDAQNWYQRWRRS